MQRGHPRQLLGRCRPIGSQYTDRTVYLPNIWKSWVLWVCPIGTIIEMSDTYGTNVRRIQNPLLVAELSKK